MQNLTMSRPPLSPADLMPETPKQPTERGFTVLDALDEITDVQMERLEEAAKIDPALQPFYDNIKRIRKGVANRLK